MSNIGGVLAAIVILLVMVTVHEFGHYIAGKALGFKITEFAVGFGPAILKKRSKKTGEAFSLRVIPLGGFCAFDGEDDGNDAYGGYYEKLKKKQAAEQGADAPETGTESVPLDGVTAEEKAEIDSLFSELEERPVPKNTSEENTQARSLQEENVVGKSKESVEYPEPKGEKFNDLPPWKRIIVLVAGALMNYLLALLLTLLMLGIYGAPRYEFYQDETEITAEQPFTGECAVQVGDVLLEIDGNRLYLVTDYMAVLDGKKAGDVITVSVLRAGERVDAVWTVPVDVQFANMSDTGSLFKALGVPSGYGYGLVGHSVREGFFQTIGSAFEYSFKIGGTVLRSLGELLTGKLGLDAMGGPATTIGMTAQAATNGFESFLNVAALIGVNLAVFNLLPVPALDGCKVIFCIIEWIRKKPVNRKVEAIIHFAGIVLIFGFAIFVDIFHLF